MNLTREQLREWLDRLGVEHQEMAEDFGILKSNLSHILSGRQKLTPFRAKAFECWLILKEMHDSYTDEYESKLQNAEMWRSRLGPLDPNYRLAWGEALAMRRVINDLKQILGLELIEESPFGIVFNENDN